MKIEWDTYHANPQSSVYTVLAFLVLLLSLNACQTGTRPGNTLFQLLDPVQTGVEFNNTLEETHQMNVVIYQDFYSGGGVAIGDINNDDWPDLFFTGNTAPARLYLNNGDFTFRDITESAGLAKMGKGWYTGTTMIDINNDGFLDIFIGKSGLEAEENRKNLLYVNQGDGTFSEQGKSYGLDHAGYAVNATFFDYDRDGDLDMYLVNQGPEKYQGGDAEYMRYEVHEMAGDKLFENTGERFIDVTQKAGIFSSIIGFAHGVAAGDINDDGWEDLFVSNDFFEHDYIYLNNGDKTFREITKSATKHISYYSMGNDLADFNNDGLLDIVVLDMVAEDNQRLKENLGGMKEGRFQIAVQLGYHYQYMANVLHLNHGNDKFSEIGQLAGISSTDWSWAPVFADFNNDGWKDLYVTNGIRKDIRNIDWGNEFHNVRRIAGGSLNFTGDQWDRLLSSMPSKKVPNYMYMNEKDLSFKKVTEEWGLAKPTFSNGIAYADLDRDGDLDLVVNNIDDQASVYMNNAEHLLEDHFLRIKFEGPENNTLALGTKVRIHHNDHFQYQQHYITRGYRSSMEPIMHFGLGQDTLIQRIDIIWPDGKATELRNVKGDQEILVSYSEAKNDLPMEKKVVNPYFTDITSSIGLDYSHEENDYNDYLRQSLLPYRYSWMGPALATGDVNGDGLDDLYIGGAFRRPGGLFIQTQAGGFEPLNEDLWTQERMFEDVGAVFFDADNDKDLDLYVTSGGSEFKEGSEFMQDRLYINAGDGRYKRDMKALPVMTTYGSRVIPADYDSDGDQDLFVGGRMVPGEYPLPADSYLLQNQDGKFTDISPDISPEMKSLGLVTDAVWTDIDEDKDLDLIVVGEWMPLRIFKNVEGRLSMIMHNSNGLENSHGWWHSIAARDFDGDGDMDLVAGNLGLNYKYKASVEEPFEVYYGEFGQNEKKEMVLAYYQGGKQYPVDDRIDLFVAIPELARIFTSNNDFSRASVKEMFTEEILQQTINLKARTFASTYIENMGDGRFQLHPFDNLAQISNQNDILIEDVDQDGHDDLIMAGNLYGSEVETIRNDAGIGIWLKGDGKGHFDPVPFRESGLFIDGDVKNMALIKIKGKDVILSVKNNGNPQIVKINRKTPPAIAD